VNAYAASTITAKGQTTVPKEVRDALGLKPGELLIYDLRDGKVTIRKSLHVSELAGILHRPGQRAISIEEMDHDIAKAVADRDLRAHR
jgi:antitoxin PrlF